MGNNDKKYWEIVNYCQRKNLKNFKLKLFQIFLNIRYMTSDFSESSFYIFR